MNDSEGGRGETRRQALILICRIIPGLPLP
jgi:hypothetical protein